MKDSTGGLGPDKLLRILLIGTDESATGEPEENGMSLGEALLDRLGQALPLDPGRMDSLSAVLGRLCRELRPVADRPLGQILCDPQTDPSVLEVIKEYGRTLAARSRSPSAHACSVTVYFAAIAAGLVHHDAKITRHSYAHLVRSFSTLAEKPWMVSGLVDLFRRAREICDERASP